MSALAQPTESGAASAAAAPPTRSAASHPSPRPHSLPTPFCAHCNAEGAANYCTGCSQRSYCSKECQTMDWKKHKTLCKKLQGVHRAPAMQQQSDDAMKPGGGERGGGGGAATAAAAAAGGGSSNTVDEGDEIENPCPVCLDNEDDATVVGDHAGMCTACGQSYCGACKAGGLADRSPNCPTCRAPFSVSDEENFERCWKLEHDRSPGRHTPAVQYTLGNMYFKGTGVERDKNEAVKWCRKAGKAAEAGHATAQYNLSVAYINGYGVTQDRSEGLKWVQLAAVQGYKNAPKVLDAMQQDSAIPTPPPGTAVTTILLTSAKACKYNSKTGRVVEPPSADMFRPGIAFVLLDDCRGLHLTRTTHLTSLSTTRLTSHW
eukprot:gene32518-biopygen16266